MGVSVNYSWKYIYMAGVFTRSPISCNMGGEVVNLWLL